MGAMDNVHTFNAMRGIQAGREYYSAMCPLRVIAKIFLFDEEELTPELRAQRSLNRTRIPEIASYIVDNPRDYIFSSITASIDGEVSFEPFSRDGVGQNIGRLLIPMTSRFLINDGQHRRAAIEDALRRSPELGDETLSVVFFVDAGLKRSQQMFADLNRHAIRPTQSLGILYDHRDALSQLARRLASEVSVFRNTTEMEKTTISNRSNKLHTLSAIYQATRALLGKSKRSKITNDEAELAKQVWEAVADNIGDWKLAAQKKISCAELRRDFIHAHGLALQAIAIMAAALLSETPRGWKPKLRALSEVDWSRANTALWEGRALVSGRVSKSQIHIDLTASHLKQTLGLPLTARERQLETQLLQARGEAA
jgi:DNA sulfur modification protein DndB